MSPRKTYILKLYVAGNTPNSMRALKTLRNILDEEFRGVYALKVIDVLKNPQLAEEDKILATPTLAKILPPPVRRIIGDLSDRERVLIGLDLLYDELSEESMFDIDDAADDSADSSTSNLAGNSADILAKSSALNTVNNLAAEPAPDSVSGLAADDPGHGAANPVATAANQAENNMAC
jgi:circadian clock protein KaiB